MNTAELLALMPFLVLVFATVLLLLQIAFFRSHLVAFVVTCGAMILAFVGLLGTQAAGIHHVTALFSMGSGSVFFMGLLLLAAFFVTLFSYEYLKGVGRPEEYYLLVLTATIGSMALACSENFASFFLGLEILSVSLYALISYVEGRARGIEAGVKYLVLAGVSSAILLFGMALIYAFSGTLRFSEIGAQILGNPFAGSLPWIGATLVIVGVGFKLALVPFHMWAPDVYEGAPVPVTAYIATVSKGAVFVAFLRFVGLFGDGGPWRTLRFMTMIAILAIASMTVGNLLALFQRNLKRLLAYSSTVHLGYLLVALLAGATMGTEAVAFYFAAYFATTLAAFGILAALSTPEGEPDRIEHFQGLFWRRPFVSFAFALSLLSLAGIPLTAGFTGKFYLVSAGIHSHLWYLVILLVLNSALGLFYYLRVIVQMISTPVVLRASGATIYPALPRISWLPAGTLTVLTLIILVLGVYPGPVLGLVHTAVAGIAR